LYESRGDFPPATARSAELLAGQLERFERLLVDLLEISRYDARAAVLEPEPVDVTALVSKIVEDFEPAAAKANTRIDFVVHAGSGGCGPIVADVDTRRVARVLRNLLSNAIDHAEGAPVEVALGASC